MKKFLSALFVVLIMLILLISVSAFAIGINEFESPAIQIELLVESDILEKHAATLPLKITPVGFIPAEPIEIILIGTDGTVFGEATADMNGKALIRSMAFPKAGTYIFVANSGTISGSLALKVISQPANIWTPVVMRMPDGQNTVIAFGAAPVPQGTSFDGKIAINNGAVLTKTVFFGNGIIIPYAYDDLTNDDVITIKKVTYPSLFPGYSFTFTLKMSNNKTMTELNLDIGDADNDGLFNWVEDVFHTDKDDPDTDDDGLSDGLELKFGMNPLKKETLNDGVLDGDRTFTIAKTIEDGDAKAVKPVLEIQLQGKQIETLSINKVDEADYFLNDDIPGYVGNAFDFGVEGAFSSAKLTFEFDAALLQDPDFIPAIYYWNDVNQLLEEIPNQTINGNTVTAFLEHFSSYILLNKKDFDEVVEKEIKRPNAVTENAASIDLAIVIDNSGSMDADSLPQNDPGRLRYIVAKNLIDKLDPGDRVCVVHFETTAALQISFTADKQAAKNAVDDFSNGGRTAMYDAIAIANDQFVTHSREEAKKMMVVLTDGIDNASSVSLTSVAQTAVANNVTIYTIGLGPSLDLDALTSLAQETGGQYYHAEKADELSDIFEKIAEEDIQIDTDKDGLPDYFEKLINDGTLTLGTGAPLWDQNGAVKLSWNDPANQDSDNDGLKDGAEIKISSKQNLDGTYKVWVYLNSNPCMRDSDRDGLLDNEDPTPFDAHDSRFEKNSDALYRPASSAIDNLQRQSDSVYKTQPVQSNDNSILSNARLTILGARLMGMTQSASALNHFVGNTGSLYTIDAKELVKQSPNAREHLNNNLNLMIAAAEKMVMEANSLVITTNALFRATTLSSIEAANTAESDWKQTLGTSNAAMTGIATRSGDQYSMRVNYFIDDFYDWEKGSTASGGLVTAGDMYRLHEVGLAKQYRINGRYQIEITWNRGQRFNSGVQPTRKEMSW